MFIVLKEKYGHVLLTEVRRLIKCFITIARQQCHLDFNHRCTLLSLPPFPAPPLYRRVCAPVTCEV